MLRLYVICVALAACGDHEVAKLEQVRDQVCACKTVQCADTALALVPHGKVESTPRAQKVAREMLDCLAELYEEGRPTMDPDAEVSDPETSGPASARRP